MATLLLAGREAEIGSLNLEIVRLAASLDPGLHLPQVGLLGQLIVVRAVQQRRSAGSPP